MEKDNKLIVLKFLILAKRKCTKSGNILISNKPINN